MAHAHFMLDAKGYRNSEYIFLIAPPLQKWLHEGPSVLRLNICTNRQVAGSIPDGVIGIFH
jgi:hypothetical protein